MRADQRLAYGLVVVTGSLTAHAGAYALASSTTDVTGHSSTDTVLAVLVPAMLGLIGLSVVRAATARGSIVPIGVARLATAQAALFATQELVEGLGSGQHPLEAVSHPTLLIGLALQPIVAMAMVAVVRRASDLGSSLSGFDTTVRARVAALVWTPTSTAAPISVAIPRDNASRAPPR